MTPHRLTRLVVALVATTATLVVMAGGAPAASHELEGAPDAPASTKILIALVEWPGNPAAGATVSDATNVLAHAEQWLESASRGQIAVTGQVRGWTTITAPSSPCAESQIRSSGLAALGAAGVNTASFDEIVLYFGGAAADACPWYGKSGRPVLIAGKNSTDLWDLRNVVAHEVGHNWGLNHANALMCVNGSGQPVSFSGNCSSVEQGDPYDVMGYAGYAGSFNAWKLIELGWMPDSEVEEINRSAGTSTSRTIAVKPLTSTATGGTRAIVVEGVDGNLWTIEVRTAVGVDQSMFSTYWTSANAQGVQIRRIPVGFSGYGPSELLDMHPTTPADFTGGYHSDSSLDLGSTWTSPDLSLTVAVGGIATGTGGRFVTITTRDRPAAPGTPTAVKGEGRATVSWTAPADGGLPITGYTVTPYVGGVAQTARSFDSTATTQVITGLTPGATYTFRVTARNALAGSAPSPPSAPITLDGPFRPFASWDAFVARQLTDFAGSPGTVASRAPAVAQLASGAVAPDPYIVARIDGPWYGPVIGPVSRLYWAYFNRTPDVSGVTYWAGRRRTGTPLDTVSQSFAGSAEFTRIYGALSNRQFVERIYLNVLGRPGEESGIAYWTSQLDQGTRNRGKVMTGFSESSEFKTKRLSDVNTFMAYAGMLGRAPTNAELTSAKALSRTQVVAAIRLSAPYAARVT